MRQRSVRVCSVSSRSALRLAQPPQQPAANECVRARGLRFPAASGRHASALSVVQVAVSSPYCDTPIKHARPTSLHSLNLRARMAARRRRDLQPLPAHHHQLALHAHLLPHAQSTVIRPRHHSSTSSLRPSSRHPWACPRTRRSACRRRCCRRRRHRRRPCFCTSPRQSSSRTS